MFSCTTYCGKSPFGGTLAPTAAAVVRRPCSGAVLRLPRAPQKVPFIYAETISDKANFPMDNRFDPLSPDETFVFDCHPQVACFNACCRDLNQFLTPYDILRLKQHLGIDSGKFLQTYASEHLGPQTGLPVVTLRCEPPALRCPFVSRRGCRVYPARPTSCRLYPLARAISRSRSGDRIEEHFAVVRESHCDGFRTGTARNPRQWMRSQQADVYAAFNDLFLELIRLKNRTKPGPLPLHDQHGFRTALYDLDRFRLHLDEPTIAGNYGLTAAATAELNADQEALLRFAHRYVKREVFGEN